MATKKIKKKLTCGDCATVSCGSRKTAFPAFCLTEAADKAEIEEVNRIYREDPLISKIAVAAAEIEGVYYGKLTRVEEVAAFAKRINAKKIGIATCVGLLNETKSFVKFLDAQGISSYTVACKVGAVDKTEIGIPAENKIRKGEHESACNPVLQARILAREKTDLNVIVGLCVGHDSMFIKYSEAPTTYLVVKDRILAHNPVGALHCSNTYYKRLSTDLEL
ncbi:MAG: DUF1847 domain-containing protein [Desulfuromonadaceae bacterium]